MLGHLEPATPSGTMYQLHAVSVDELVIVETGDRFLVEDSPRGLQLTFWGMTAVSGNG